jgi:hypothetical protein
VIVEELHKEFPNRSAFYSHQEGFDKIKSLPESVRLDLRSLDATNWTDNLPNRLQFLYLKHKFGLQLAQAWRGLAVDCDWSLGNSGTYVRYGKGQGMGTKGSFIIASATNTVFIDMLLAHLYGDGSTCDKFYITVGDDMVVHDPENLVKTKFEEIGVPINESKSKHSVGENSFIEFVSRNAHNGMDYSIVSPSLLAKTRRQPFYVRTLAQHLNERCRVRFEIDQILDIIDIPQKERDKILFLNCLFDLGQHGQDSSIELRPRPLSPNYEKTNLIVILKNCFILIGQFFYDFVNDKDFRSNLINNERALLEYHKYLAQEPSSIWEFCTKSEYSPKALETLMITYRFKTVKDRLLVTGLESSLEDYVQGQLNESSTLLQDIAKLFNLALTYNKQVIATSMRINTLSNHVVDDVKHHRANLELFRFLNKAISLDRSNLSLMNILRAYNSYKPKLLFNFLMNSKAILACV